MNNAQIKYAKEKITSIFYKKRDEIYKKYKMPELSDEEKLQYLREGKFTVNDKICGNYRGYLNGYITFTGMPDVETIIAEQNRALKEVENTRSRMMDELILGDVQEALDILRDFEAKEF